MSKGFENGIVWGGEIRRVRGSRKITVFDDIGIWARKGSLKVNVNHKS